MKDSKFKRSLVLLLCLCMLGMCFPAAYAAEDPAAPADQALNAEGQPAADGEDGTPDEDPAAEDAPEEPEEPSEWETRLLLMLQEHNANPATIAAGYYNFATGEEHYYNGDEYRVSGSMYKVPLNMLYMDWIAEGDLTMDELISGYRYSELLEGTIINSDNDYARIQSHYPPA